MQGTGERLRDVPQDTRGAAGPSEGRDRLHGERFRQASRDRPSAVVQLRLCPRETRGYAEHGRAGATVHDLPEDTEHIQGQTQPSVSHMSGRGGGGGGGARVLYTGS